jgi:hypothetical protein
MHPPTINVGDELHLVKALLDDLLYVGVQHVLNGCLLLVGLAHFQPVVGGGLQPSPVVRVRRQDFDGIQQLAQRGDQLAACPWFAT